MAIHGMPLPQPKGLALTFVMAATFGLYVVLTAELDRTESFLTNLFYSALGVFVPLTLALPLWWQPLTSRALAGGAVVGILGWLTLAAMDLALRRDRPSRLAIFLFSQIVAQEFLSALLGRHYSRLQLLGIVIVTGVVLGGLVLQRRSDD
jgi:drug/metabolite transporter (DMT)-like permease